MKKLVTVILCLTAVLLAGCSSPTPQAPPPKSQQGAQDTTHLTAQSNGLGISVSREVKSLSQMIPSSKKGYDVVSILVKAENNTKANIPVSPEFVTLKTIDGTEYKYSKELTENGPLGKSAFIARTIPPEYNGGGLLLFELKTGSKVQSITYKDSKNHDMTIKFPTSSQTNV